MIEEALVDFWKADGAVNALCNGRIFPQRATQGKKPPYVTYFLVTAQDGITNDGPLGHISARYQLDCWSPVYADAKRLAKALRDSRGGAATGQRLHGFAGVIGGIRVQGVWFENLSDSEEAPVDAGEQGWHRITQELVIWYEEAPGP